MQGHKGMIGSKGAKGSKGDEGPKGMKGSEGSPGEDADQGDKGKVMMLISRTTSAYEWYLWTCAFETVACRIARRTQWVMIALKVRYRRRTSSAGGSQITRICLARGTPLTN